MHKEHREAVKERMKYNTGPSRAKCVDCPKIPKPEKVYHMSHLCLNFKNDRCISCGNWMKRGLGAPVELVL